MSPFRYSPSRISPLRTRALGICLLGGLLLAGMPAQAEEAAGNVRWVSDSLNTYVRSGPTDGYRIVGTLSSGQKVELLRNQGGLQPGAWRKWQRRVDSQSRSAGDAWSG